MSEYTQFYVDFFTMWHRTNKEYGIDQEEEVRMERQELYAIDQDAGTDKVEVAIGQGKTATFYRAAGDVLLECEESAFYLDREEAYRLLSLLEAEFKGSVA